jgi:protein arginine kinase activator
MRCQACKQNPATFHLTLVVDEASRTVDLCEPCAKRRGMADPAGFSWDDLLVLALGAGQEMEKPNKAVRRRGPKPGQDSPPGPTD